MRAVVDRLDATDEAIDAVLAQHGDVGFVLEPSELGTSSSAPAPGMRLAGRAGVDQGQHGAATLDEASHQAFGLLDHAPDPCIGCRGRQWPGARRAPAVDRVDDHQTDLERGQVVGHGLDWQLGLKLLDSIMTCSWLYSRIRLIYRNMEHGER